MTTTQLETLLEILEETTEAAEMLQEKIDDAHRCKDVEAAPPWFWLERRDDLLARAGVLEDMIKEESNDAGRQEGN